MPRVVHFEIAADDPQRAVHFYRSAFDWKIESWGGQQDYWLAITGSEGEPGIDGAIQRRGDSVAPVVNTIAVPDLDAYIRRVQEAGGKVTTQKMPIPGVGWWVSCVDTEGNPFGMLQPDRGAR